MPEPEDPVAEARRLLAAGEAHHAELLAVPPRLLAALCGRLAAKVECDAPWHKERAWGHARVSLGLLPSVRRRPHE